MYKSHSLSELDPKSSGGKWRPLKPLPQRNSFTKGGSVTPIDIDVEIDDGESQIGNGFIDVGQQQFIEDLLVDKINLKRELKALHFRLSDALKGQPKTVLGGQFKIRDSTQNVQTDESLRAALKSKQKMIKELTRERDAFHQALSDAKSDAAQLMTANADMQAEMDDLQCQLQTKLICLNEQVDKYESLVASSKQTEKSLRTTLREHRTRVSEMEEERDLEKAKYGELIAREERQRFDHERALQSFVDKRALLEANHCTALAEYSVTQRNEIRAGVKRACARILHACSAPHVRVHYAFFAWCLANACERRERDAKTWMAERKEWRSEKELFLRREMGQVQESADLEAQCAKRLEQMRTSWGQEVRAIRSSCSKEVQSLKEEHRRFVALQSKVPADDGGPGKDAHARDLDTIRRLETDAAVNKEKMDSMLEEHEEMTRKLAEAERLRVISNTEAEMRHDELQTMERENVKHRSRYAELSECYAEREPKDVRIRREQTLMKEIKQLRAELEAARQLSPKSGNAHDPGRFRAPRRDLTSDKLATKR